MRVKNEPIEKKKNTDDDVDDGDRRRPRDEDDDEDDLYADIAQGGLSSGLRPAGTAADTLAAVGGSGGGGGGIAATATTTATKGAGAAPLLLPQQHAPTTTTTTTTPPSSSRPPPPPLPPPPLPGTTVLLSSLHWWTTDAEVEGAAREFGQLVCPAHFYADRASGRSRGAALLRFGDAGAASRAVAGLSGRLFDGRPAAAALADLGQAMAAFGYGGGGVNNAGGGGGGGRSDMVWSFHGPVSAAIWWATRQRRWPCR